MPLPVHGFDGDKGRRLQWALAFSQSSWVELAEFPQEMMTLVRSFLLVFRAFWKEIDEMGVLYAEVGGALARLTIYDGGETRYDQTAVLRRLLNSIVARMPKKKVCPLFTCMG